MSFAAADADCCCDILKRWRDTRRGGMTGKGGKNEFEEQDSREEWVEVRQDQMEESVVEID